MCQDGCLLRQWLVVESCATFSPGGVSVVGEGEDGIHLSVSLLPVAVSKLAAWMDPVMLFLGHSGWA